MKAVTHIEIGNRAEIAHFLGIEPHVELLCGDAEGDAIWDDIGCMELFGGYPAACTCYKCKQIAAAIRNGLSLEKARKTYGNRE